MSVRTSECKSNHRRTRGRVKRVRNSAKEEDDNDHLSPPFVAGNSFVAGNRMMKILVLVVSAMLLMVLVEHQAVARFMNSDNQQTNKERGKVKRRHFEEIPPSYDIIPIESYLDRYPYEWRKRLLYTNNTSIKLSSNPTTILRSTDAATATATVDDNNNPFDFRMITMAEPSCSDIEQQLQSNEKFNLSLTLVTQCSVDRLEVFQYQCKHWGWNHPISIAIYSNETENRARETLVRYGCNPSQITITMIPARYDNDVQNQLIYPYNLLRNAAFSQVQTSHALYVDCDFMISDGIYEDIHMAFHEMITIRKTSKKHDKTEFLYQSALVLPAFKVANECYQGGAAMDDKSVVLSMTNKKIHFPDLAAMEGIQLKQTCTQFMNHLPTNRKQLLQAPRFLAYPGIGYAPSHASTDYGLFLDDNNPPPIVKRINCLVVEDGKDLKYEPYLVLPVCRGVPLAQESFVGYGEDKTSWISHLVRFGYDFWQMNYAFCLHLPHPQTSSLIEYLTEANKGRSRNQKSLVIYNHEVMRPAFETWMTNTIVENHYIVPQCMRKETKLKLEALSGPW